MKESVMITELTPKELETMIASAVRRVLQEENLIGEKETGLLDDEQIAEILGVSKPTLYLWRRDRKIPFRRIGKKIFYQLDEVQKAMGLRREKDGLREKRTSKRKEQKQ